MRTADKNRINRAIEHLNAARTNLDSIKEENRTDEVDAQLNYIDAELAIHIDTLQGIVRTNGYENY